MLKIGISTNSSYKINAILKTLYDFDIEFIHITKGINSGVSEQPIDKEVQTGSLNRAKGLFDLEKDLDLAIGCEFGYINQNNTIKCLCISTVYIGNDIYFQESSSTLELPKTLRLSLKNDKDVQLAVEQSVSKINQTQPKRIYSNLIKKRRFIEESIKNVFLRYLVDKKLYK